MIKFRDFVQSDLANEPHFMVIGHPIGHSLSPLMHETALAYHGIDARYHAVDVLPGDLTSLISWMNRGSFQGANITIPYKRELLSVVDRLDNTAMSVGAINTLVKSDGELIGYNTDVDGFRYPLEAYADQLEGGTAILFGSGGASLAVRYALHQLGLEKIVLVSRSPGSVVMQGVELCNYSNWQAWAEEAVLLVNSTPLGMAPVIEESPVDNRDVELLEGKICYDLVYNPLETRFLRLAREAGAETINGLEMFIAQGDRAFQLWTGVRFPWDEVYRRIREELEKR